MACRTFAWGPVACGSIGQRGYKERHVFRVASCPGYQFMRSLQWNPKPLRLAAISDEVSQSFPEEEFRFSGPCVDCLQTDGNDPVRPETLSVHAGEREGRPRVADSLTTPIVQTSTYCFRYPDQLSIPVSHSSHTFIDVAMYRRRPLTSPDRVASGDLYRTQSNSAIKLWTSPDLPMDFHALNATF